MAYTILMPEYYPTFSCIGGNCQYTCCRGWEVAVTKADYKKLRGLRAHKELSESISACIRRNQEAEGRPYAVIHRDEQGFCPLLNGEYLCKIHKNCGPDFLPTVCATFPRSIVLIKSLQLGLLSCFPSCEVVVRQFIQATEGLGFIREERELTAQERQHILDGEAGNLNTQTFIDVKSALIDILQNRAYKMRERMILLSIAVKRFCELSEQDLTGPSLQEWLRWVKLMSEGDSCRTLLLGFAAKPDLFALHNLNLCRRLPEIGETICKRYHLEYGEQPDVLKFNLNEVLQARTYFDDYCPEGQILLENLMVNYVFHTVMPFPIEAAWGDFRYLACLFSLFQFVLAASFHPEDSLEELVKPVVVVARTLMYNQSFKKEFLAQLDETGSDTPAHMALLLNS